MASIATLPLVAAGTCLTLLAPSAAFASPDGRGDITPSGGASSEITVQTVTIGKPRNRAAGIVPFTDAIYRSCSGVTDCVDVGRVRYAYKIGRLEVTVRQWVTFLNTVDPAGKNRHHLYDPNESSTAWPKYGQVNFSAKARAGQHYTVAYPEWARKPYGFADFLGAARFANSLQNGSVISQRTTKIDHFKVTKYRVRLSSRTERGMYDMARRKPTRKSGFGFVIPSENEWIKSAYFDPKGGGTDSYWKYPTNPGVFGEGTADGPSSSVLNPANGNVTNSATQPLATDLTPGVTPPTWCPWQVQPQSSCDTVYPLPLSLASYQSLYKASLGTVGQAKTLSPWGTLDQGGNAVEWTDTFAPAPTGTPNARVWRRVHGGVPNATAYQLWLSATGYLPQSNVSLDRTYPWLGFRIGVIGGS